MVMVQEEDRDVPEMAVKAMEKAHARALDAGHTLVFVRDGKLLRIKPDGTIRQLQAVGKRRRVTQRVIQLPSRHEHE